jgi:hypothetical protein
MLFYASMLLWLLCFYGFMPETVRCNSRRSFLSSDAGGFLAACLPRRIRFSGDDMAGPTSAYRGQKTANTRLKYNVFVTPSIPS